MRHLHTGSGKTYDGKDSEGQADAHNGGRCCVISGPFKFDCMYILKKLVNCHFAASVRTFVSCQPYIKSIW